MGLLDTTLATVSNKKPRNADRILPSEELNLRGLLDAATTVPVVGDVLSGGLAVYDAAKGDYGSAALNAISVLPFLSAGMIKKAGKVADAVNTPKLTEFEQRHLVAQRNAALPVEQGGLGLPPNNTAMDRAKAMGFEDGLYHGGTNDFPAFRVSDRSNVYATDDPMIADIYANATGRHKALRQVNAEPNVIPLMYRGKLAEVSDQGPGGGGWYRDNLANQLGIEQTRTMVKDLPSQGFYGVKVTEMEDLGGKQNQYIFPDPSVLRSRFAAFDPMRRHEADLLGYADPRLLGAIAGGGLLGLGGYSLLGD